MKRQVKSEKQYNTDHFFDLERIFTGISCVISIASLKIVRRIQHFVDQSYRHLGLKVVQKSIEELN